MKCSEEANKLKKKDSSDYIESFYRKMVYEEALKDYKSSRLYFSSPVCHSCYQTYCFMDIQRNEQGISALIIIIIIIIINLINNLNLVLRPVSTIKNDHKVI